MISAVDIEKLVDCLATSDQDEWLYLNGVGWLTVKRYTPYSGRNPRTGEPVSVPAKFLPFFVADPELRRALNDLPPPDEDAPLSGETIEGMVPTRRLPWADALSARIREQLVAGAAVAMPGFGAFEILAKAARPGANPDTGERIEIPARRIARFVPHDDLKRRLSTRR